MSVIVYPPPQTESWSLAGTGSLLFTSSQRQARNLTIVMEKVRSPGTTEYYNFRYPEPSTFWGYVQTMSRDYVLSSRQLSFRREALRLDSINSPIETEQLRCLIRNSTEFLYGSIEPLLLGAGLDAEQLGADLANYRLSAAQEMVVPTRAETALWYEIIPGYTGYITLTWSDYPILCENVLGKRPAPPPSPPSKGESGDGGAGNSGGGGFRPPLTPPPDRTSDPNSDSEVPPPSDGGAPSSPNDGPSLPPPGDYIFTVRFIIGGRDEPGGPCRSTVNEIAYGFADGTGPGQLVSNVLPPSGIEYLVAGNDGVPLFSVTSGTTAGGCPPQILSAENVPARA